MRGIYKIVCNHNDRVYINSSVDVEGMIKTELQDLEMRRHRVRSLQRDWNRYGRDKFNGYLIKKVHNNHDMSKMKTKIIKELIAKRVHLYNDVEGYDDAIIVYDKSNPEQIVDEFLNTRSCAKFLRVSHTRIAKAVKQNRIKPSSFIRKKYIVCHKAVHEWHLEYIKKLLALEPNAIELKDFRKGVFKIDK